MIPIRLYEMSTAKSKNQFAVSCHQGAHVPCDSMPLLDLCWPGNDRSCSTCRGNSLVKCQGLEAPGRIANCQPIQFYTRTAQSQPESISPVILDRRAHSLHPQAWPRDSCPASPPLHHAPSLFPSSHLQDHSGPQVVACKKLPLRYLYESLSARSGEGQ
jgi:hypothetical protein